MMKPLSAQLAELSTRAKHAEDAFTAAQKELPGPWPGTKSPSWSRRVGETAVNSLCPGAAKAL
jgi:hypothetical protein